MEPVLKNHSPADDPKMLEKIESISLVLKQLEEEARECGFEFTAFLIRVAANSFSCDK